jgi:hypothetical protein
MEGEGQVEFVGAHQDEISLADETKNECGSR